MLTGDHETMIRHTRAIWRLSLVLSGLLTVGLGSSHAADMEYTQLPDGGVLAGDLERDGYLCFPGGLGLWTCVGAGDVERWTCTGNGWLDRCYPYIPPPPRRLPANDIMHEPGRIAPPADGAPIGSAGLGRGVPAMIIAD